MARFSIPTRPTIVQRLKAAVSRSLIFPAQKQSDRMPDLERWKMPHRAVDMADWEVAKNMASNLLRPDRTRLMDLYDSILVDSHLASTMESRVLRVVRSRFRLVKNGKADPELLPLLQTQWFEDFLGYVAEAAFRGHTVIELGEMRKPGELRSVNRIDPRNVLPYLGVISKRQGDETGYKFREPPLSAYLIEVGRPEDLGLLCDVAPVAIVKKYAVGSWSDFVHKFGIPPRWVKTSSMDARRVRQLEAMMQDMISSAYGVIQGDETIEIMTTPGTDAFKVFDELIKRMNSEMSKRILGQDGTSDHGDAKGGTYGSLKVLQGVAEDRHAADLASVGYVINQELLPRLTALGYPFNGVRFEWDRMMDLAPLELVDAVSKLGMVMEIDPKYVEERTGIRILGQRRMPGELSDGGLPAGAGRQGGGKPAAGDDVPNDDDDDDGGITAQWPRESLGSCGVCGGSLDIVASAGMGQLSDDDMATIFEELQASEGLFSQHYFHSTADVLNQGFGQAWGTNPYGLLDQPDPVAYTIMEANIYQFSGAKTRAMAVEVNAAARNAKGYGDFKRQVDELGTFGTYQKHLRTEYANAVNCGSQASRYYSHRGMIDSMPLWRYDTMEDGRVRTGHAELHGKVFRHNDRIWNTIYPPNGWGCRCTVIPMDEHTGAEVEQLNTRKAGEFLEGKELTQMAKGGFDVNRAKVAEVFKLNASYRTGKRLVFGYLENYGADALQQSYEAINRRQLPAMDKPFSDQAQARVALFRGAEAVHLPDHAGRQWKFTQKNFDHHTAAGFKDPGRLEIAHHLADTLSAPDEVWLMGTAKGDHPARSDYKYIRYYEGKTMVVETRATLFPDDTSRMEVHTWHDATADTISRHRLGLLVKKNAR